MQLYDIGYKNIDALDASPEMLEVAKQRNSFKRTFCAYLGSKEIDVDDGASFSSISHAMVTLGSTRIPIDIRICVSKNNKASKYKSFITPQILNVIIFTHGIVRA